MRVAWINISSKSGNSFMTVGCCDAEGGGRKKVFSQGILRKNNNCVPVDVFIYVFAAEASRTGSGRASALNNTANRVATFFLSVGRTDLYIYYLHKHLVS